jgi:hypothetical protein
MEAARRSLTLPLTPPHFLRTIIFEISQIEVKPKEEAVRDAKG